jgi:hypothetical protein
MLASAYGLDLIRESKWLHQRVWVLNPRQARLVVATTGAVFFSAGALFNSCCMDLR